MNTFPTAEPYIPDRLSLSALRTAARTCRGCPLYRDATQVVMGEGLKRSRIMMVGEVPGDREDVEGSPFVGPAGRLLRGTLDEVGIPEDEVYLTNAVKHFKFERRGKRRIHQKPSASEIRACRPWLDAEIDVVRPELLVALGATAAQALFGSSFRVSRERGRPLESETAPWTMATVHPSSILRTPERDRARARHEFVADLRVVADRFEELNQA